MRAFPARAAGLPGTLRLSRPTNEDFKHEFIRRTERLALGQCAADLSGDLEEERVIRALDEIATVNRLGLVAWDVADGFSVLRQGQKNFPVKDLTSDTLLPHLAKGMPESCVVVLKDFHLLWGGGKQALATRRLRNMAPVLRKKAQYLVITAPERSIPLELKDAIVALDVPLPDAEEMAALFEEPHPPGAGR